MKTSKRRKTFNEKVDPAKLYSIEEACGLLKETATAKFNETIELHVALGIDPKRSDQNVRGTIVLPHGTGKTPRVIAFAKGDKAKDAEQAGADQIGADELITKVKGGWNEFDVAVATPDMMAQVGSQLGKILGPRMPNPKSGTVGQDMKKMVTELKSGKVEYRIDKQGLVHSAVGKASFDKKQLAENLQTIIHALVRAKPPAAKGQYLKSVTVKSTMGPGIKLDGAKLADSGSEK